MPAPYSVVSYTGTGSATTFNVPFPYIDRAHVEVYVDGVLRTGVTWDNASTVRLPSAPPSGAAVLVQRNTPKETALVDFQDAGVLTESALDLSVRQSLFIVQESFDNADALVAQAVAAAVAAAGVASRSVPTVSASDIGRLLVGRAANAYGWATGITVTEGTGAISAGSLAATGAVSASSLSVTGAGSFTGHVTLPASPTLASHAIRKDYVDGAAGRTAIGATTTGSALITAADAATARTAIGATATGSALLTSASANDARLALGAGAAGAGVFVSSTADLARAAISAPPQPTNAGTVGQVSTVTGASGGPITLPAGGTWFYFLWRVLDSGDVINGAQLAGVAPGGTTVATAPAGTQFGGFVWRIA